MINLSFLKPAWNFCKKHVTKILCGLAIGTEAAAIYCTAKEAPIVKDRLEKLGTNATNWEKIKTAGKLYLPAAGFMLVSMGSIVGGTIIGDNRLKVADSLLSLSNATIAGYQKKLVDAIGRDEAQVVEDEISKKLMEEQPSKVVNVIATGKGDQLIFDPLSGRFFTSTWNDVEKAAIHLNQSIIGGIWVTVNEWYGLLGLEDVGLGETAGWNVDQLIDIGSTAMKTADGRSCLVISYYNRPVRYK